MTEPTMIDAVNAALSVPKDMPASRIVEECAGLLGVAAYRASDKQSFYDDLGALLSLVQGFRQDLRTIHKVKP